jgi:hypothetical protein
MLDERGHLRRREDQLAFKHARLEATRKAHREAEATSITARHGLQGNLLVVLQGPQRNEGDSSTTVAFLEQQIASLRVGHARKFVSQLQLQNNVVLKEYCQQLFDSQLQLQNNDGSRVMERRDDPLLQEPASRAEALPGRSSSAGEVGEPRNTTKHETELLRQHLKRKEDLQMLH